MGDKGRLYVDPALVTVFRERAPSLASLITPNVFEAQTLVDDGEANLHTLAENLEQAGFAEGLITSAETLLPPSPDRAILCFEPSGQKFVHHEGLSFQREPNGVGDFVAALSAGLYGQGSLLDRTTRISKALVALLKVTQTSGSAELALVEGQKQWVDALS